MNIGFLASHNGNNMQAIIDDCKLGALQATPAVGTDPESIQERVAEVLSPYTFHYNL